jgi:hypothetical protein
VVQHPETKEGEGVGMRFSRLCFRVALIFHVASVSFLRFAQAFDSTPAFQPRSSITSPKIWFQGVAIFRHAVCPNEFQAA